MPVQQHNEAQILELPQFFYIILERNVSNNGFMGKYIYYGLFTVGRREEVINLMAIDLFLLNTNID